MIERTAQWRSFYPILQKHDAFLCPTMRIPAPRVGERDESYYAMRGDERYYGLDMTSQLNLIAPCPVLSVPAGWSKDASAAGPKMAALLAAAAESAPDVTFVNLTSEGVILIYGRDERAVERISAIEGVERVLRMAGLRVPAQLRADFYGQGFVTDTGVFGIERALVDDQLPSGTPFEPGAPGPVPAVISGDLIDMYNTGFAKANDLPFPLVSDPNAKIAAAYGVARLGGWLPTKRVTFVIDKKGVVRQVIKSELGIDRHIDEAIEALRNLAKK